MTECDEREVSISPDIDCSQGLSICVNFEHTTPSFANIWDNMYKPRIRKIQTFRYIIHVGLIPNSNFRFFYFLQANVSKIPTVQWSR